MNISSSKGNTGSWWHAVAKQLLKLLPGDVCNNVPIEGKALGYKIFSATEKVSENKYNGVGWLLLSVLENSRKDNHESKALNSQLKILLLWQLWKKLLYPVVARLIFLKTKPKVQSYVYLNYKTNWILKLIESLLLKLRCWLGRSGILKIIMGWLGRF